MSILSTVWAFLDAYTEDGMQNYGPAHNAIADIRRETGRHYPQFEKLLANATDEEKMSFATLLRDYTQQLEMRARNQARLLVPMKPY